MIPVTLGTDLSTQRPVRIDPDLFRTHFHLLGATGSGKTTAIETMLRPILMSPRPKAALFLIDPMGNLSMDLLRWMADTRLCPRHVRRRLVYIEPAREDVVLPFNPLLHESEDHLYYQVGRAVEIVLRAWASQEIDQMPRLRQWTFNSFFAAAAMGFPLAACQYLLRPGTDEHEAMLRRLPNQLRLVWSEILQARGSEAVRILESTRNRLAPFFDSGILRRMFGCTESRFDVERFIRERRIVILNVAGYRRLDSHIGHTIGGLAVNEIIQTAMGMSPTDVDPTYILLDEFQHFVGPDLYDALPLVRQLGLRLILAHQSFAQLERGDIDLSGLIWQARSRLMFASDADDADRIAHELATLTFDPKRIKDVLYSRKQRIAGHRREWVESTTTTRTTSHSSDRQESTSTGEKTSETRPPDDFRTTDQRGRNRGHTFGTAEKHADSHGISEGRSETLVPVHEDFSEVSNITYSSFEEQRTEWAQRVRKRRTGEAFGKFKDDPRLYDLAIDYHPVRSTPAIEETLQAMLEANFNSEFFLAKNDVERQAETIRQQLLGGPTIRLPNQPGHNQSSGIASSGSNTSDEEDPFR